MYIVQLYTAGRVRLLNQESMYIYPDDERFIELVWWLVILDIRLQSKVDLGNLFGKSFLLFSVLFSYILWHYFVM